MWWSGWLVQQLVTDADADADDGGGGGGGRDGGVDGDGWRQPVAAAAAAGGGAVRHQRCWAAIGARMIGRSALAFQNRVEAGEEGIVGVNVFTSANDTVEEPEPYRPERAAMEEHVRRFRAFKSDRDQQQVSRALSDLARAANGAENVYEKVVDAAMADVTHGEIVACLRAELGFGQPVMVA